MQKSIVIFLFFTSFLATAQDSTLNSNRGTIKVQKKGRLYATIYDDVNFRLVCKDVYGNIIDTAVVSFDIDMSVKGIAYSEKTAGNFLSSPMQQRLSRMDGIVMLMFSNIKAKEQDGKTVSLPNFKAQTGVPRNQTDY